MSKHTPTPWRVEQETTLIWGGCDPDDNSTRGMGVPVAKCHVIGVEDGEANAALIVAAVNSYEPQRALITELVEALEKNEVFWRTLLDVIDADADETVMNVNIMEADGSKKKTVATVSAGEMLSIARAALTRAKEGMGNE